MKKINLFFTLCLFGMISIAASAIPNNTIYYTSLYGKVVNPNDNHAFGGATIVSNEYSNGQGIITFDRDVTSIGFDAFLDCSGLTSVTIPNSVTWIGDRAFSGCLGLTSVTIPKSVTSIGQRAFYECSGLKSVTIPDFVTSIGFDAFYGCSGLTSVTIPNSVISIGSSAFLGCSGLKNVTIPKSVISIGSAAFEGCSGLTSINVESGNAMYDSRDDCNAIIETSSNTLMLGCKNTIIPNSVTSIGSAAFYNCSGLISVTIPNIVTEIGEMAFHGCSGLTSVTVPYSVKSIGSYAFSNCYNIEKIEYYANCQYSPGFSPAPTLKEVIIGDSVTTLNTSFNNCWSLRKLTLGKSLQNIRQDIFSGCSSLKEVHSRAENPPYLYPNVFKDVPLASATLYVPVTAKGAYAGADTWKDFGTIVSDTPDPVYRQLSITASKYGKVLYNGKEITGTTWNGKVEQGENLTFTIAPNPGCYLEKVTMNGMNVTKYLVDNVFTIEGVESDITLNVTFEKEDLTLTVKTSEGVEKEIDVEPGQQFTFNLSAYIDNIASVTFNGKDVTADIETKTESIPVWQLANSDIDKCSYQLYTTPVITESSELIITYKVNHPKGDTNEDGTVDVADITATASIILTGKAKEEEDLEEEW